jgi:hypothetical protein
MEIAVVGTVAFLFGVLVGLLISLMVLAKNG